MTPSLLRSRLLALLTPGFLAGAPLAACGGQTISDQGHGTPGTSGAAGSVVNENGEEAGIAGAGGGAGGGSPEMTICYTADELRTWCTAQGFWSCPVDGGAWDGDARFTCPDSLANPYCFYAPGPPMVQGDSCCYHYVPAPPTCGRPFLVEGRLRRAESIVRRDWLERPVEGEVALDAATKRALARAWLEDARLEHASIASFARFILEQLAVGAPSDLVADAQRAAGDEVDHARRCFSLASRYAENELGPGALSIEGQVLRSSLIDVAVSAVREGCVGETLAAIQAEAQLAGASDARACAALEVIAADEARHAELAWRFVRWALATGGSSMRAAVTQAFREALAHLTIETSRGPTSLEGIDVAAWREHGRLLPSEERACRLAVAREVIEPCCRALLEEGRPRAQAGDESVSSIRAV